MLELIASRLSPEMLVAGFIVGALLVIFAMSYPTVCFALGFPALLFLGQLREVLPVSISAGSAIFPLAAFLGVFLNRGRPYIGNCERLLIALSLLMVSSVSYSASRAYGMEKAILFCFMVLPVIVVAPAIHWTSESLRLTLTVIFASLVVYVLTSLLLLAWGGGGSRINERVAALHDVTVAAQYLAVAVILLLVNIMIGRATSVTKAFYSCLAVVALVLLLKTGTRSPVLAIAVVVMFLAWFTYGTWSHVVLRAPVKIYGTAIVAVIVGLTSLSLAPETRDRFTSFEAFFSNFAPDQVEEWEHSRGRALNYAVAVRSLAFEPVWGLGAGGYKDALAWYLPSYSPSLKEGAPLYPHNMLLEFGAEQGVLGLALIIAVLRLNFRIILALRDVYIRSPAQQLPIASCVGCFILGFSVSMTALDIPRMMMLWWGMGLLLAAHNVYVPVSQLIQDVCSGVASEE